MELDSLDQAQFDPLLQQQFDVVFVDGRLPLKLVEVKPLGGETVPDAKRKPFSLTFLGPMKPQMPQRIYPLEHTALGRLEIFLVPIGPAQGGMQYEAVFA